jgi:hypothetical protein
LAKQVLVNLFEFLYLRYWVNRKILKLAKAYDDLIADPAKTIDERRMLRMQKSIEKQNAMLPNDDQLIYYYQEGIIQLGFLCLFANSLPIAAVFCLITNMLEIKTKLY